jgi:hypothetical protein
VGTVLCIVMLDAAAVAQPAAAPAGRDVPFTPLEPTAPADTAAPPGPRLRYDRPSANSHEKASTLPFGGLLLDAGIPDGLMLSGVVRPAWWVRLHAGAGSNSISPGVRAGAGLTPFGSGPSLAVEAGHYFEGDANGVAQSLFETTSDANAVLRRVGYDFANAHLGLEFGQERVLFFIHGGVSYVRTTVHDVNAALADDSAAAESTTMTLTKDPTVVAVVPSAKVGFIAYLL